MEKVTQFFKKLLGLAADNLKTFVGAVVVGALLTAALLQSDVIETLKERLLPSTATEKNIDHDTSEDVPVLPEEVPVIEEVTLVANSPPCFDEEDPVSGDDGEAVGCYRPL